ncbi:MAG: hypothetical protein KAW41_03410 [Candidatus Diapherotrites archaeon]|nr:hypothetical protein [Candidatus Diapherotrites archaeon]
MTSEEITEGKTRLAISPKVFFNPLMESNRSITVQLLNSFFKKPFTAIDALSGSGAKGVRIANETRASLVILNDMNPNSKKLMQKSVSLNKLKNTEITSEDANVLLSKHKFSTNFVDIDPFGSPAPFTDSAVRALLPKDAVLGLTATDTGALAGSFKNAARRRYGVRLEKTPFYNELGVRALAGFAVREAGKYDTGLSVLFAHATGHYYRVFLRTHRGKGAADAALKQVRLLLYCPKCGNMKYGRHDSCHGTMLSLGPVWSGKIYELNLFDELDTELPFFDLHRLYQRWGKKPEKFVEIEKKLGNAGYKTSRTHFSRYGIRCDASFKEFRKTLEV